MFLTETQQQPVFASHHDPSELPLIIRLLTTERDFDPEALQAVLQRHSQSSDTFEEALIRANLAGDHQIAAAYAQHYLLPVFAPPEDELNIDPALAELIPSKLCRDHLIVPVALNNDKLKVAFFTPDELLLLEELHLLTSLEIAPAFAPLSIIERSLGILYDEGAWSPTVKGGGADFQELEDGEKQDAEGEDGDGVVHLDQPPPPGRDGRIIRYVNQLFEQAVLGGASDVHIEPYEDRCQVRLRIDGALNEISPPPMSMFTAVISRIKVLAKMDIAEKRIPQDGAIGLRSGDQRVDMRVNTCPTVNGEKVVMRVLDKNAIPNDLGRLGLDERQEIDLTGAIQMPHGLMLVTGPTGSGKSTTLYSALSYLNTGDNNICTVEDPVEYKFDGINQVQTQTQIGRTFASTLRSFLRQDPDVIMVGEIRDNETAEICLRAALTGHLVLSTLHTNHALAAIPRLQDMGVEPFLLASTLRAVVAQRLIRRLCEECREPYQLDEDMAKRFTIPSDATIYRGVGCGSCNQKGHSGRLGVFEIVRITKQISDLIQRRASSDKLRDAVIHQGMKLMAHSALDKVRQGLTSLEEALTIVLSEEE